MYIYNARRLCATRSYCRGSKLTLWQGGPACNAEQNRFPPYARACRLLGGICEADRNSDEELPERTAYLHGRSLSREDDVRIHARVAGDVHDHGRLNPCNNRVVQVGGHALPAPPLR